MDSVLSLAAVLGFAAALARFARALLALLRSAAEAYMANETAGTRARRGDVTGMAEAERYAREARRLQARRAVATVAWGLALALPAVATPWPRPVYASYLALWLVLRAREKRTGE